MPRVPVTTIPRPGLTARLSNWPDVTVVHGPIGAGKSTLLAAWANAQTLPVHWIEPEQGKLPLGTMRDLTGPCVLVIDPAEQVDVEQWPPFGVHIDRTPQLRVVVATRSTSTAAEIAAASDASLDLITATDLAVTLDELRDADLLPDDTARADLIDHAQGLAIAVRAAVEESQLGADGVRTRLGRLLRSELEAVPALLHAAIRIALVPEVDCEIMAAWGLPSRLLAEIDDAGIATFDGECLRLHPFIRGVLRAEAQHELTDAERRSLIGAAVRARFAKRAPRTAVALAFEIVDMYLATEIALRQALDLLEQRDATYALFTTVPVSPFSGHPLLMMVLVMLSLLRPETRARSLQLLAQEALFQRTQPECGTHLERVVSRALEASIQRFTPFAQRALPMVIRAADDYAALAEADKESLGRLGPWLQVHFGIGAFYLQNYALAERCLAEADARNLEAGRRDRVDALSLRGGIAALTGDLLQARQLLTLADDSEWPPGWRTASPADFFHLGRAVLALEDGDLDTAGRHLDAAGPVSEIAETLATLCACARAAR